MAEKTLTFERCGSDIHVHGGKIDLHFANGTKFQTRKVIGADDWALFAWDEPTKEN